jgi:hypothetical protein
MMWVGILASVLVLSGALVAWAAVYRYGPGNHTLAYGPSGGYTCPVGSGTVRLRYGVDGNTIWDSYGTVKFYGNFRDVAGGTVHYHEKPYYTSIDFDQNYRGWDTGHRYAVSVAADPSGLSYDAPMVLAIFCQ